MSSDQDLSFLDNEDYAAPLIAAARTLMSVAETSKRGQDIRREEVDGLYIHAAAAFGMLGNFATAEAAIKQVTPTYLRETAARRLAWAVCSPAKIEEILEIQDLHENEVRFYRSWKAALGQIRIDANAAASKLLRSFAITPDVSDAGLLLSTEVAFRQAFRLAIAHLQFAPIGLPNELIQRLQESGRWTLLPPQKALLADQLLTRSPNNALLNLPTSTGKTLIAEACMAGALTFSGGIAVYVAPYVAIGEQVLSALRSHMPNDIRIVSMFGGFKSEFAAADASIKQVIVATPERFDGWLRSASDKSSLRIVVFDELHNIENGARGAKLEGMVSRLRIMQKRGAAFRILSLSAVLPEADWLRNWLGVSSGDFHRHGWRPTARRLAICRSNGDLQWIYASDPLRPANAIFGTLVSEPVRISLPRSVTPTRGQFVKEAEQVAEGENIAAIAIDLAKRLQGAGLIVCTSRANSRRIAAMLASQVRAKPENAGRLEDLAQRIQEQFTWLSALADFVRAGVAYHNSTLPFDVRRWLELAIRDGDLQYVAATTTLAEGADLPFRWTLVSHWLKGTYADAPTMNPLIFKNIVGRSGRAGAFAEGDTVLYESLLGPTRPILQDPERRVSAIMTMLTDNSPLRSSLAAGDVEEEGVHAAFESQFLAAISENPSNDNIVQFFSSHSYAGSSGAGEALSSICSASLDQMLDASQPGGALAVRNSPVALTDFGQAANKSGFSPKSVRTIVGYMSRQEFPDQVSVLLAEVLIWVSGLPELNNPYLRKTCTADRHQQFLKKDDIAPLISSWLAGAEPRTLFEQLPSFKKTTSKPEKIEDQFDKFIGFVDGVLRFFGPWLLRAMATLSEFGGESAKRIDWVTLARTLERREEERGEGIVPQTPF
ncbi:DEAD/DEAH box helicase [Massilia sp. SR12]